MINTIKALILLSLLLTCTHVFAVSGEIKVLSDIAYGTHTEQTLDVYIPANAKDAPVILMVHGGAWQNWGDKADKAEVENKIAHWVTQGFILISTNFRALPNVGPVMQAKDVTAALHFSQGKAREWGGSPEKFILMGHSSGAHAVSLVSSNYRMLTENNIIPVLGTVSMDSSAYNIVGRISGPNPSEFYQKIFGLDPDYWQAASPFYALNDKIAPFLAICSTQSATACIEAEKFLKKAKNLGSHTELIAVDLSHEALNSQLGKGSCYTSNVDDFLKKLSPAIASLLSSQSTQMSKGCVGDFSDNNAETVGALGS